MACHFSCYGTGLSNLPDALPAGTILILNDRTPVHGHDPGLISAQLLQLLEQHKPESILLDFQRPDSAETAAIAQTIVRDLPCPVAVSDCYAQPLACPVFLASPPLHKPLETYLAPWQGREIWLEAALEMQTATVTKDGCSFTCPEPATEETLPFYDETLFCHYRIAVEETSAKFLLSRKETDLLSLLKKAEQLGVTRTVGLYQELWQLIDA